METAHSSVRRRRIRVGDHHLLPRRDGDALRREMPLTQLMKYAVPMVVALLILRHQPKPDALFLDNPAPLWCFVAATAVYWLIVGALKKKSNFLMRRAALASGIQSALSLLAMFVPYPLSMLPLLIFAMPLALFLAYTWIIRQRIINKIQAMLLKVNSSNQPNNLPV